MRLDELARRYHEQIDEEALNYFATAGIPTAMVEEFRLGWVYEPLLTQHEGVRGTPVFPFLTVRDKVVQLRFDAIRQDLLGNHTGVVIGRDYPFALPEHHLYNVRHTLPGLRTSQVVIVSDIRSAIVGRAVGWRTVAAPGYDHWFDPWTHLFDEANPILVWNETEDDHVEPIAVQFKRRGIEVLPVRLPDDHTLAAHFGTDLPHGTDIVDLITETGVIPS